ncbi:MAG: S26 family signal peptidase [Planctomycetota bacterium]|nr:S26 family signal peptidase [Planctomycetota bacterium]
MKNWLANLKNALLSHPSSVRKGAESTSPVRSVALFFMVVLILTAVPVALIDLPGSDPLLRYLYVGLFPASAVLVVFLVFLFVHLFFLKLVSVPSDFRLTFNVVFSFFYDSVVALALAGFLAISLQNSTSYVGAVALWVVVLIAVIAVVYDALAHIAALGSRRFPWACIALAVLICTITPAVWLVGRYFWASSVFNVSFSNQSSNSDISTPNDSLLLYDHLLWRINGIDRFTPVMYANQAKGGESSYGRVVGLPGENLELAGGNVFFYPTSSPVVKPPDLQEHLWKTVFRENYSLPRFKNGFSCTVPPDRIKNGRLHVFSDDEFSLAYSPAADSSAYPERTGITDLDVFKGPSLFRFPSRDVLMRRWAGYFETDRDANGNVRYWGVSPADRDLFCARCGKPWPPVVRPRGGVSNCRQCGHSLTESEAASTPVFSARGGLNPVYDVKVSFDLLVKARKGTVTLRYAYHDVPLKLIMDCEKGSITLNNLRSGESHTLQKALKLNIPHRISLACYDGLVSVSCGERTETFSFETDLGARVPFDLTFLAQNASVAFDNIHISRDQYYTASEGIYSVGDRSIVSVPKDSYFVLSDDGQSLNDSRSFGCIPSGSVTGVPLFVIWPVIR